ncbi:MAG TPA: hypothetical protein VLI72_14375 [Methylibium sp.]|nr:hypothetical protein [Methylibium sp.]
MAAALLPPYPGSVCRLSSLIQCRVNDAFGVTVVEAESIVFDGRIIENHSADSHDILGTFAARRELNGQASPE